MEGIGSGIVAEQEDGVGRAGIIDDDPFGMLAEYIEEIEKDQDVVMSVRPEELILNRDTNAEGIAATVDDCVFLGLMTHYFVHLESGEEAEIIQESSIDSIIEPGTKIRLTINTDKVNLFTADGSKNILTGVQNDCAAV